MVLPQPLGPSLWPFPDAISLVTDGREKTELINSSIDSNFSIEGINLPIKRGRAAIVRGGWRLSAESRLAGRQVLLCLRPGHLIGWLGSWLACTGQGRMAKTWDPLTLEHLGLGKGAEETGA